MGDQRYSLRGRLIAEKNPPRQALIFRFCDLCSICYKIDLNELHLRVGLWRGRRRRLALT
jgi:hypothetical protein